MSVRREIGVGVREDGLKLKRHARRKLVEFHTLNLSGELRLFLSYLIPALPVGQPS